MTGSIPGQTFRLFIVSVSIWGLAAAVCFGLHRYGKLSRRIGAVQAIGSSAVPATMVDTPQDAYRFWKQQGFHGRTILFVAAGWDRIDPAEFLIDDPRRTYPLEVYRLSDRIESSFLDASSFMYVAALQGIARQVIAVVAPAEFDHARENARRAKNARVTADSVYITYQGFPRWFTTLAKVPSPDEPVLLYVAASAFREHRPDEVLSMLRQRRVQSDAAVLCAMIGDDRVTEAERRSLAEFARLLERGGA